MKTKLNMKKVIAVLALALTSSFTFAQDVPSSSSLSLGADFQSRYIWRGQNLGGDASSIQPSIEYATGKFTFGTWGAFSTSPVIEGMILSDDDSYSTLNKSYAQEIDTYVTYAPTESLSFVLTDYHNPSSETSFLQYNSHILELGATYTKGAFGLSVFANVAGNADKIGDTQAYSSYVELSYSKKVGDIDFGAHAGAVIFDRATSPWYSTDGSGFINLGLTAAKEIKITDSFSLPVNAALTVNPESDNVYLTFGFSL